MASRKNSSRKSLAVALAIVGVAGLSMASAAQLTVDSNTVAAGVDVVAACDASVTVAYGTAFSGGVYVVNSVTIGDLGAGACTGRTVDVTLMDGADGELDSGSSATIAALDTSVTISGLSADAETLEGIAVVIH